MPYPGHTTEEVARRARAVYERDTRSKVEPELFGRFLEVDVRSDDHEIADDDLGASEKLLKHVGCHRHGRLRTGGTYTADPAGSQRETRLDNRYRGYGVY